MSTDSGHAEYPGHSGPVTVEQHRTRILNDVSPLTEVEVPLTAALGLALTSDIVADLSLPRFDNSAMDGYAVRLADLSTVPVTLPVADRIGAGQAGADGMPAPLAAGTVAKIMTGAPIPPGADAVVPYEWTDRGAEQARIERAPDPGQHIRPAGDDVRAGETVLRAGTELGPRQLGLLASVGRGTAPVRRRPRVAVISTGSELRAPGERLSGDSIYDGNSYLLAAAALAAGVEVERIGIVDDDPQAFLARVREVLESVDAVVTSGGVSQGDYDVVKAALRPLGTVWFGAVAMQPGKPQGYGRVDGVPIFTLPGNPVSAYISFQVFVLPALRAMAGIEPAAKPWAEAELATPIERSPAGRRQFLRGLLRDGRLELLGGPGSHLVAALAGADVLIVVPEDATSIPAGARLAYVPMGGGHV